MITCTIFKSTSRKIAHVTLRKSYARRSAEQCIKHALVSDTFMQFETMKVMMTGYLLGKRGALTVEKRELFATDKSAALYEICGQLRNAGYKVTFVMPRHTADEVALIKSEKARIKQERLEQRVAKAAAALIAA